MGVVPSIEAELQQLEETTAIITAKFKQMLKSMMVLPTEFLELPMGVAKVAESITHNRLAFYHYYEALKAIKLHGEGK